MADNDAWLKAIGKCWKKPYEAAWGTGDAWDVAARVPGSLSLMLRERGGVPDFAAFVEVVKPCFGLQRDLFAGAGEDAQAACEELARARAGQGLGSIVAEVGARVAQGIVFEARLSGPLGGDAGEEFARRLLPELARSLFVERLDGAEKVIKRFAAQEGGDAVAASDAMFEFTGEVSRLLPMMLEPLARKLARDPSGQKLPRRVLAPPKPGTEKLLSLVVG